MAVLIGRNGVGKTNILRAIAWAAEAATSEQVVKENEILAPSPNFLFELVIDGSCYVYELVVNANIGRAPRVFELDVELSEVLSMRNNEGVQEVIFSRIGEKLNYGTKEININKAMPAMPALTSVFPDSASLDPIRKVCAYMDNIHYYPMDEPCELNDIYDNSVIVMNKAYMDWSSSYRKEFDPSSSVLMRIIYMSQEERELYDEFLSLVGRDGLGLFTEIDIARHEIKTKSTEGASNDEDEKSSIFYLARFRPFMNEKASFFMYKDLSLGTRRILRLIVSILCDKNRIMLVEQPEDSIHSGLLHKLISIMKSYSDPLQIILTSHSVEVLNKMKPDEIRLVSMYEGRTLIRSLDEKEVHSAHKYMCADGSLSEFLNSIEDD